MNNTYIFNTKQAILREEAYNTICDLLVVFCNQLTNHTNPLMHQLVYEPDQAMQNMLNRFIQEYVFFEEEDGKQIFESNALNKFCKYWFI